MECNHAYLRKDIEYVLCDKEPAPSRHDRAAMFHAACPFQEHCPKENCHKMTPGWLRCAKLAERPQNAAGATFATDATSDKQAAKAPTKSRRKPQE